MRGMRERYRFHCIARKYKDDAQLNNYRVCRNKLAKTVQKAHYDNINHKIGDLRTEQPRSFWIYAKLMRTENIGIPTLRTKTKLCTIDKENAGTLNESFLTVLTNE